MATDRERTEGEAVRQAVQQDVQQQRGRRGDRHHAPPAEPGAGAAAAEGIGASAVRRLLVGGSGFCQHDDERQKTHECQSSAAATGVDLESRGNS